MSKKNLFWFLITIFLLQIQVSSIKAQTALSELASPSAENSSSPAAQASPSAEIAIPTPADTINLAISPINMVITTDPGVSQVEEITIANNSREPEYLEIELATFDIDYQTSTPQIRPFEPDDFTQDWLRFSEEKFVINPQERKIIKVTFSPPDTAALGYNYTVIIKRQEDVSSQGGDTVISGAPGILVLGNVNSPLAQKELQLVDFVSAKRFYEYLPTEFIVRIQNSGNVHTFPSGNIFIDSLRKDDVAILELNEKKGLILPQAQREFTVQWEEGFPVYEINENGEKKLKWDFSQVHNFRFGKYEANLLFIYDNGERDIPIEAKLSFWVIPWKILLAGFAILLFAGVGIFLPVYLLWKNIQSKKQAY